VFATDEGGQVMTTDEHAAQVIQVILKRLIPDADVDDSIVIISNILVTTLSQAGYKIIAVSNTEGQ
jgi:hypothetical protein